MQKLVFLVLAGLTFALAACGGGAAQSQSAQQITIEANEFKFSPATIEVSKDKPVKLLMQNKGTVEHDWAIMKIPMMGMKESGEAGHAMGGASTPELHMSAMTGKTATVEFTPTQAGTYQIACTVAGHKEAGMVGTLVVK